jgi:ABC-type multidrug transport system fused ATPase/permease subunit
MSYNLSIEQGLNNASKMIKAGANAVKIEGCNEHILALTKRLVESGIPVLAHLGLTPQLLNTLGGYKIQGKSIENINDITISNLSFMYEDKAILKDISHKFEKNKSYAIVGPSGAGKTTLINLLLARENNYTGNIYYNGIEVREISLDSLYEISSFVEQNVFVFDDSIINNITMYSNVDEELLNEVIIKSGLTELIKEKGKDYSCGENGSNLSGGEKQRISIARALINKSQLLLLDEVTSALDNETSSLITNQLLELNNTTRIMITHRLDEEVLNKFDQIIVMKNGKIVECGTYYELINKNSIFKSLVEVSE